MCDLFGHYHEVRVWGITHTENKASIIKSVAMATVESKHAEARFRVILS